MATFQRIAPIFAVHDLDAALAHYTRLGFATRTYGGGGYGFAHRDGLEIHLGTVPAGDPRTSAAYLFVDDAGDLAAEWRSAGVEVHGPEDTPWGQHEGAVVDPDGNVIRSASAPPCGPSPTPPGSRRGSPARMRARPRGPQRKSPRGHRRP